MNYELPAPGTRPHPKAHPRGASLRLAGPSTRKRTREFFQHEFARIEENEHEFGRESKWDAPARSHSHSLEIRDNSWIFVKIREKSTMLSSFIDPRSRPHYFVEIVGDSKEIVITAGYGSGPLSGGGPIVGARKVNGRWCFEPYNVLWKN